MDLSNLQPYVRNGEQTPQKEFGLILADADLTLRTPPSPRASKGRLSGEAAASI
jgi:hypothetical protein